MTSTPTAYIHLTPAQPYTHTHMTSSSPYTDTHMTRNAYRSHPTHIKRNSLPILPLAIGGLLILGIFIVIIIKLNKDSERQHQEFDNRWKEKTSEFDRERQQHQKEMDDNWKEIERKREDMLKRLHTGYSDFQTQFYLQRFEKQKEDEFNQLKWKHDNGFDVDPSEFNYMHI